MSTPNDLLTFRFSSPDEIHPRLSPIGLGSLMAGIEKLLGLTVSQFNLGDTKPSIFIVAPPERGSLILQTWIDFGQVMALSHSQINSIIQSAKGASEHLSVKEALDITADFANTATFIQVFLFGGRGLFDLLGGRRAVVEHDTRALKLRLSIAASAMMNSGIASAAREIVQSTARVGRYDIDVKIYDEPWVRLAERDERRRPGLIGSIAKPNGRTRPLGSVGPVSITRTTDFRDDLIVEINGERKVCFIGVVNGEPTVIVWTGTNPLNMHENNFYGFGTYIDPSTLKPLTDVPEGYDEIPNTFILERGGRML